MTDADHLSAAQRLEPLVASVRDRLDRERRLPDELIQAIGDAGLFGMWLPRAMGGPELPPLAFLRVVEELSRQDGSIGWCTAIAAGHGRFAGALPHRTACEIFGSGRTILAGTLNPAGKAVAVPGGYRVTGRWRYGSVIDHSAWVYGNCVIHDEAGPRQDEGGMPLLRLCLFPKSATEVIDAWQVSGLRGTGSHDFQVTELLVPEHNTIPLADFTPVPTQPGAIYAIPMASIFASVLAAIVLGIARAAIEALMVLAADKTPAGSQSVLRENALPQADLARAEAFVRGGRAFLFDEVETMWQEVQSGREMTIRRRGLIRLAACQATQWAIRAVDLVYAAGGGSSIREANRFERCFVTRTPPHSTSRYRSTAIWSLSVGCCLGSHREQ